MRTSSWRWSVLPSGGSCRRSTQRRSIEMRRADRVRTRDPPCRVVTRPPVRVTVTVHRWSEFTGQGGDAPTRTRPLWTQLAAEGCPEIVPFVPRLWLQSTSPAHLTAPDKTNRGLWQHVLKRKSLRSRILELKRSPWRLLSSAQGRASTVIVAAIARTTAFAAGVSHFLTLRSVGPVIRSSYYHWCELDDIST
jgi:hypothetical protein